MKRTSTLTLILFTCLVLAQRMQAQATITTFDAPGAGTASGQGTIPATPNLFGAITGQYIDTNNVHYGFLRKP